MQISRHDIEKNKTVANCKKCNGSGMMIIHDGKPRPSKNPNVTVSFPRAVVCECRRNEIIENTFLFLSDPSLPKITSEFAEVTAKTLPLTKNYRFTGNIKKFLITMKAIFVHHRRDSSFLAHISNGLDMVLSYYVAQDKGVERKFTDLTHGRDLVVILCNTKVSNAAVGPGVLELVQTRLIAGKPTWVFTPDDFDLCSEFSDDLKKIMEDSFVRKTLKTGQSLNVSNLTRKTNA